MKRKHWIKHVHSICIAGLAPDKIIHKAQNKVKAWDASKVSKKDNFYSEGFYQILETPVSIVMFSNSAMENLTNGPIPEMITTKASPHCTGEIEINMQSKMPWQGHLHT